MSSGKAPVIDAHDCVSVGKDYDIPAIRELALSAIQQSVLIVDAATDFHPIIYANPAFSALTGYAAEEVVGKNCRFLAGPDTSAATRAEISAALAARRPYSGIILNYRKDGSAFWNQLTLTPVEDAQLGRFWIGIQVDVTEKRELEERLSEAQRMEAIGKLSGGIAHDFNNILALVLGNAEVIADDATAGSPTHDAATDIIEAAEGGSRLVKRMLQYAAGQAGETEDIAVNVMVENVMGLVRRSIGRPIRHDVDLSAAVGRVHVDRAMFETALLNLIINARDAIDETGTVTVTTRRRINAGPALGTVAAISVSDDGCGMDEAVKARAFEPFFTTKNSGSGNGLGLAMVYNFVKRSGGDVLIESVIGQGTTVTMLLPIDEPMVRGVPSASDKGRILIVEDDPKVRRMLVRQLDKSGYIVDEAASAEEALEVMQSGTKPALLVSDIRLGEGMTGVELLGLLRERDEPFPILLMTGFADELANYAEVIDSVPVLRKPFRTAALLAEVNQMVGRKPVGRA
jgi:PAS domain S-box-containing protein